jgi:hypothetical protein
MRGIDDTLELRSPAHRFMHGTYAAILLSQRSCCQSGHPHNIGSSQTVQYARYNLIHILYPQVYYISIVLGYNNMKQAEDQSRLFLFDSSTPEPYHKAHIS